MQPLGRSPREEFALHWHTALLLAFALCTASPRTCAYSLAPTGTDGEYLKWGPSQTAGTPGGVVTWGLVAPGTAGSESCLPYCAGASAGYLPNYYPTPATSDVPAPLSLLSLQKVFQTAFDTWSSVADIQFRYVGLDRSLSPINAIAAESPMIRIAIFSFDGTRKYCNAGAAFAPPPNVGTVAGDIFINSNVGYQLSAAQDGETLEVFPVPNGLYMTDLYLLALHEIGHAIGLGSSCAPDSVMCGQSFSVTCDRLEHVWREPLADDISGVQFLYGPPRSPGRER